MGYIMNLPYNLGGRGPRRGSALEALEKQPAAAKKKRTIPCPGATRSTTTTKPSAPDTCAVCLADVDVPAERVLECGHSFHMECIEKWLTKNPQCPVCRAATPRVHGMREGRVNAAASTIPNFSDVPPEMLERYLTRLFQIGDTTGDGVLQFQEFLELLTRCGLRFPAEIVLEIFLLADTTQDGALQCDEFIPAMMAIIAGANEAQSGATFPESRAAPPPRARAAAAQGRVNATGSAIPNFADVPPAMLDSYLTKLFQIGDTNSDGVLSPTDFQNLLSRCGFNLPADAILKLVREADVNGDGVIDFEEFRDAMLRAERIAREPTEIHHQPAGGALRDAPKASGLKPSLKAASASSSLGCTAKNHPEAEAEATPAAHECFWNSDGFCSGCGASSGA